MLYQNYVVEIKRYHNGEFEHNVFWLYDADVDKAMLKAEAKFHEILAAAALSDTASHAAILFTSTAIPVKHECYEHKPVEE